jgi:hypothetical protein
MCVCSTSVCVCLSARCVILHVCVLVCVRLCVRARVRVSAFVCVSVCQLFLIFLTTSWRACKFVQLYERYV